MKIEFAVDDKKRATIFIIIILICTGIIIDDIFSSDSSADGKNKNTNKETSLVTTNHENSPKASTENQNTSKISDIKVNMTLFEKNPFIELKQVKPINSETIPLTINPNNVNLPMIPNQPLPAMPVPNVPMPNNPVNAGSMPFPQTTKPNQETIQGIITGSDGTNTAIMGNGNVLTEGETFQDNRITYIGETGIKFEDGHTIPYNNK